MQGDLDEVLDGLHSLQGIGFFQDFRRHPERLLVYHVFELFQIAAAYRGVQLKQVIHVPAAKRISVKLLSRTGTSIDNGHKSKSENHKSSILRGLDVPEEFKVSHGELSCHFHGAELQQRDLTLPEEILSVLVRTQRLRFHIVLQVVSAGEENRGGKGHISVSS